MKVQIQKWGNSLALRIPKSMAAEIGITLGTEVDILVEKGNIVIRPIKTTSNREDLIEYIIESTLSDSTIGGISKEVRNIFKRYVVSNTKRKMMLFKTSAKTFRSVITNQKHAFAGLPKNCVKGTVVLISKNKTDCAPGEKQIAYYGKVKDVRLLKPGEAASLWGIENENRWKYLVELEKVKSIKTPFNLDDVLLDKARLYGPAVTFTTINENDAKIILPQLNK